MTDPNFTPGLYGEEPEPVAKGPAPTLADQLVGVFTEPVTLFRRLPEHPVWGAATGLLVAVNAVVALVWAKRVDVDAMLRPMLEANPKIPAEQIDKIIEMQGKFMAPFAPINASLIVLLAMLLSAFVYWLAGKVFAEDGRPSFKLAFSATAVAGLVSLPRALLIIVLCLVKDIGGATPEKVVPTNPGWFVQVDSVKLQALLHALDLFTVAALLLTWLSARHALRLKAAGAAVCTVVAALFAIGIPVLFAR